MEKVGVVNAHMIKQVKIGNDDAASLIGVDKKLEWKEKETLCIYRHSSGGLFGIDIQFVDHHAEKTLMVLNDPFVSPQAEDINDDNICSGKYIADAEVYKNAYSVEHLCVHRDPVTGFLFAMDLSFLEQVADVISHPYVDSPALIKLEEEA